MGEGSFGVRLLPLLGVLISVLSLVLVAESSDEEEIDMSQSCSENEDKLEVDDHHGDLMMDSSDVGGEHEAASCSTADGQETEKCEEVHC